MQLSFAGIVLGFLAFLLCAPVARAQEAPVWTGSVRNLIGQGVPGVEVLAYPAGPALPGVPPGAFRSDERGRFRLSGLQPGPYVLALNKPGYEVLLAQINTRWVSRLILTLIPGESPPAAASGLSRDSMDWVLRAPRSDLLKEVESVESVAAASRPGSGPEPSPVQWGEAESGTLLAARLPVNGDVEQWFTTDPGFTGTGNDGSTSSGRSTSLHLDGRLFGRGDWRVGGVLDSLSTETGPGGAAGGAQDEGAGRLRVAMNYDLGADDSVRFRARYDRDSFKGVPLSDPLIPSEQEVRTLGYEAGWSRKMDEGSGLEMRLGFLQALGRTPEGAVGADPSPGTDPQDGSILDRRWEAGALYGFNVTPDHRVQVRAATRFYNYEQREDGWILAPIQSDLSLAEAGPRGWSFSLSGQDAWQGSEPLSVTLGLDYHRAESLAEFSTIVPRVGARRQLGRSLIEGELLWRLEEQGAWNNGEEVVPASFQSENALGYRAQVLHRLGGSWTVSGHAERNPLGGDSADGWRDPNGIIASERLLLTDPASITDEFGIQVSKRIRWVEGTLGTDQGRVRGRVAAHLEGTPIQMLGTGEIHYLSLRASASVPVTDTELAIDYRRLDGLEPASLSGDSYQASRLDLTLLQQVPFLGKRLPADWRLLLAYQSLIRNEAGSSDPDGTNLPERVRRLSGGIGVRF